MRQILQPLEKMVTNRLSCYLTPSSCFFKQVFAHTVIMATGATALKLGLPSEQTFWAKGISACAICDGASPLFKNRVVAVVGGGDSACEEAVYLTKYAKHVSIH